jgi:hypothetical protein
MRMTKLVAETVGLARDVARHVAWYVSYRLR